VVFRLVRGGAHPRIRGEHVTSTFASPNAVGSSPHPRGAHLAAGQVAGCGGLIPASAGSTPIRGRCRTCSRAHPRIRGEHPRDRITLDGRRGSSPHPRGALAENTPYAGTYGLIPASAGSTCQTTTWCVLFGAHPRIRGEHEVMFPDPATAEGSSPHPRGALAHLVEVAPDPRLIPASAGSTARRRHSWPDQEAHPRIRGEHSLDGPGRSSELGSSPHPRGAPRPAKRDRPGTRLIPASAGSTPLIGSRAPATQAHPRIRGEHVRSSDVNTTRLGSSPHPRGARHPVPHRPGRRRLIPASAGSTELLKVTMSPNPAHPRIRGEHIISISHASIRLGSSPHPRGAQCASSRGGRAQGLIPASAGSTRPLG